MADKKQIATMEIEKAKAAVPAHSADLELADNQIKALIQRDLPITPHLLSVPTRNPYLPNFPHENQDTPFEDWEVKQLQYMTLVYNGDRGVGVSQGNWQDDVNARSPWSADARSSTTTPNPFKDSKKPAVKMSIADYKNLKQTGVKPSPRPNTSTPEPWPRQDGADRKPAKANTIAVSGDTPMARIPSLEGLGDLGKNGSIKERVPKPELKEPSREQERLAPPPSTDVRDGDKARPISNGHIDRQARDSMRLKEANTNPRPSPKADHSEAAKGPLKHALPPRPQSPRRNNAEHQKRPLESGVTQPQKRTKVDHSYSKAPLTSQKAIPRKAEATSPISKPSKSSINNSQVTPTSPLPRRTASGIKKHHDTGPSKSAVSDSNKPLNTLPPLLSPLPADLASPTSHSFSSSGFGVIKRPESDNATSPKPPSKQNVPDGDTIVVKSYSTKNDSSQSSPLSTPPKSSPPFILPPILSPRLPEIVEQELLRLQQKSSALNTVEARHEKARQPDAPGVARKTVRPKIGHPPPRNRSVDKSGSSQKHQNVDKAESCGVERLIVSIPYKKRMAKDIERLLATKPIQSKEFKSLEADRITQLTSSRAAASKVNLSDSEEDVPLATLSSKAPVKKRPSEFSDTRTQPAPKRAKVPEVIDVAKTQRPVTPAFKSPALSTPSQKALLATPKKGDAMKTVAMRKVDSSDGHARTPQTTTTSTPASAEKHRVNGEHRSVDVDQLRAEEMKYTHVALKLKRKMDGILKTKERAVERVSDGERKLGLCVGLESLVAYMKAFHANDRRQRSKDPANWESWFALWTFIERQSHQFHVLQALAVQLGSVCREELNKIYTDKVYSDAKDVKNPDAAKDMKLYDKWLNNSRSRDAIWIQAQRTSQLLIDLGSPDVLGPWTSIADATSYALGVLTAYEMKERVGWKKDDGF